jgi:hypothetical protein
VLSEEEDFVLLLHKVSSLLRPSDFLSKKGRMQIIITLYNSLKEEDTDVP